MTKGQAAEEPSESRSGRLLVSRPAAVLSDAVRSYKLLLDGSAWTSIRPGEQVSALVTPGVHVVQARIDWSGSPRVSVHVLEGQSVRLVVEPGGPSLKFWAPWTRTGYLSLREDVH